jgi:hypothetical protein
MTRLKHLRTLCLALGIAAVISSAWFTFGRPRLVQRAGAGRADAEPMAIRYEPIEADDETATDVFWLPPTAQRRGPEWCFDLFTPPEIQCDAATGRFVVVDHSSPAGDATTEGPELKLMEVRQALFPLQLLGGVGGDGKYVGSFARVDTGEIFVAARGREFPELGFRVEAITVARRDINVGNLTLPDQWIATAEIRETATGRVTKLTAGQRCHTDELLALVAVKNGSKEGVHELRAGDELETVTRTYSVERMALNPAMVAVTERNEDSGEEQSLELGLTVPARSPLN